MKRIERHGHTVEGKLSPTYRSWALMIARCEQPRSASFARYGARGIQVCQRWRDSFAAFLTDMGDRPPGRSSLDRVDPNGDYEPGNCRWSDPRGQARNRRNSKLNEEAARQIRALRALGISLSWIAGVYGVSKQMISVVGRGLGWAP